MTMTHTINQPVRPALDRPTAMRLAATEYQRFVSLLRTLEPDDWTRETECPGWDVRAMATHLLGMVEMAASLREQSRQNKAAKARQQRLGGSHIDALTGLQVDERADMTPDQIVARFAARAPKAAKARRRAPGFVRRRRMPESQEVNGHSEAWTLGFLIDIILTRDPWMHRIDIARATGVANLLTPDHDGVIVADVVDEWARRHAQPFALRLTGPAGGSWRQGTDGAVIEMDATEFCRTVSGRAPAGGLLATHVPF
jgi:uncharacterized protein (TIGR03083 family)